MWTLHVSVSRLPAGADRGRKPPGQDSTGQELPGGEHPPDEAVQGDYPDLPALRELHGQLSERGTARSGIQRPAGGAGRDVRARLEEAPDFPSVDRREAAARP